MGDINVGAITEALNNKVDLPTPSTPQDAVDYVVEKQDPTSANGYMWYRKYKSGWVEQGGLLSVAGDNNAHAVTFAIEMQDTNYMANIQRYTATAGQGAAATVGDFTITNLTKTSLSVPRGYNGPIRWEVKGMSA